MKPLLLLILIITPPFHPWRPRRNLATATPSPTLTLIQILRDQHVAIRVDLVVLDGIMVDMFGESGYT